MILFKLSTFSFGIEVPLVVPLERMRPKKKKTTVFQFPFSPIQYKGREIGAARPHAIYQGRPGTTTDPIFNINYQVFSD